MRKRSRGGTKPPGRTLPLPVLQPRGSAGGASPTGSSPIAPPSQQQPAYPAPAVVSAEASPGQAPATAPPPPQASTAGQQQPPALSNGPIAMGVGDAEAVGSTLADMVLSEPPPRPEPAAALLDPVVPVAGGAAPIARPRSRAAIEEGFKDTLASGVLANGIPALPADLSLDGPPPASGGVPALQGVPAAAGGFGGFASALAPGAGAPPPHAQGLPGAFAGSGFGFGGFGFGSVPASAANLWQQQPPAPQPPPAYVPQQTPPQQHLQQQPVLGQPVQQMHPQQRPSPPPGMLGSQGPGGPALDALYGNQGGAFGAFSQPPMQQHNMMQQPQQHPQQHQPPPLPPQQQQLGRPGGLQAPQFGTFNGQGGGQPQQQQSAFGGFGQAFVPTGKQPDWSVPSMGTATRVPSSGMSAATQVLHSHWQHPSTCTP